MADRSRLATPWVIGPLAATLLLPLLFGAAWFALGARWSGPDAGLPRIEALDYGRGLTAGVAPLRSGFIEGVLGDVISLAGPRASTAGRPRTATSSESGDATFGPRTVVDHPLSNDEVSNAHTIRSIPFTARTDTRNATRKADDPSDCSAVGDTVWYRYRSPRTMLVAARTFGSDHPVSLGVYRKTTGGWVASGCDEDRSGNAFLSFTADASTTYYFQIAAPVDGGRLVFSLDPHGSFRQASLGRSGEPMNSDNSGWPSISGDGRYVAFSTWATNLVGKRDEDAGPVPCQSAIFDQPPWRTCWQVYVRDLRTGVTERISQSPRGEPGNGTSYHPIISSDGRFVVFESTAANLVDGSDPNYSSVYVFDRRSRRMDAIPTGRDYTNSEYPAAQPSITDDGRFVAFSTFAELVPEDTNFAADVFVYDRQARRHERVNLDHRNRQSPLTPQLSLDPSAGFVGLSAVLSGAMSPFISGDGRFVLFRSDARLVPQDRNTHWDTYLRDRRRGTTELISVTSSGEQPDGSSLYQPTALPTISGDGRYVAFVSGASNLVGNDGDTFTDVFVRDRDAGRTMMVSNALVSGEHRVHVPVAVSISADGRFVGFESHPLALQLNFLPRESAYEMADVYRHDLRTGTTIVVTQSDRGDAWGVFSSVSRDGGSVVFMSGSEAFGGDTRCSPGDHHPGRCWQVFVYRAPRIL